MSDRLLAENLVNTEQLQTESHRIRLDRVTATLIRMAADKTKVFTDIDNLVCDAAVLHQAWLETCASDGAETPGVDSQTVSNIVASSDGVRRLLDELRTELRSGTY